MVRTLMVAMCLAALGVGEAAAQRDTATGTYGTRIQGGFNPQPAKSDCIRLPSVPPGPTTPALPVRVVCRVEVTVSELPRCLPTIDPGALILRHADFSAVDRENFRVRWVLKARGGNLNNLSFAPEIGIEIIQDPDPNNWVYKATEPSDDDGELNPSTSLPIHRVRAIANQTSAAKKSPQALHYNVTVLRKDSNGVWVQCGAIDPLIVNTD